MDAAERINKLWDEGYRAGIEDWKVEREKLQERVRELEEVIKLAVVEMAALLPIPSSPDWMPALGAGNSADAECLDKAYKSLRQALAHDQTKEGEK